MQNNVPEWLDRKEYPFTSNFLSVDGQRLHFIDEGKGPVILFVHGTPSWSFDWRHLIKELSADFRCIAPDHIGFGLSDKPELYDYSTLHHSHNLQLLIEHLQLNDITLVVHDFGGPIGFRYALDHPGNIKQLIVLNSWLWDFSDAPAFQPLKKFIRSPLLPFLYRQLNFSARFLLPKSFGTKKLPKKILKHYTAPFRNASERNGCLAFARALMSDHDWLETMWQRRSLLQNKKMLLVWGMTDRFVTPHFLKKFSGGFPSATVVALQNCGHFPQEEQPREVLTAIRNFLS